MRLAEIRSHGRSQPYHVSAETVIHLAKSCRGPTVMRSRAEDRESKERLSASLPRLFYAPPTPDACCGAWINMRTDQTTGSTEDSETTGSRHTGLVVSGLVLVLSVVHADTTSTAITVGATVQPVASYRTLSEQTQLQITREDVARGFVELPRATQLEIRSNSRAGYVLNVQPLSALIIRVEVLGFGSDIALDADGGSIVQHWTKPSAATVTVGYRFHLSAEATPGTYPWPLRLVVAPL